MMSFDNLPEEPVNVRRYYDEWLAAMSDDFNTPLAIASLFEMVKDVNSFLASDQASGKFVRILLSFIDRLGRQRAWAFYLRKIKNLRTENWKESSLKR